MVKKLNKRRKKKSSKLIWVCLIIIIFLVIYSGILITSIHKYERLLNIYLSSLEGDEDSGVMFIYENNNK
ncbi:MAG TPA: hypothetical protein P5150_08265 [Candidatus Ratteibacteria bacterium]|nr:hypothetical protein [Candidatus Ratteibacteria bacterium]